MKKVSWKWIWIAWLVIVCFLSLMPSTSKVSQEWFHFPHLDKIVHAIMYGILSLTMLKFLQKTNVRQPVIYVIIFCVALGAGIEFLQSSKIINRDFEIADIIANIIGTFTGILITKFLKN
ncbi:MAG TPA: VanZ family protein [Membranihabitans sp.]|nr:VanZ family protein [Membranihabitans sp.]